MGEPSVSLEDVALAEFNALRSEVQSIRQIQTAVYTAALTILAAVGGFALAKKEGRLEMLLVLPLVLSGLALILMQCEIGISNIGEYIRDHLSTRLPKTGAPSSWEAFIYGKRSKNPTTYNVIVATAPGLILFAPSVASIVLEHDAATNRFAPLFWVGALAIAIAVGAVAARVREIVQLAKDAKRRSADRSGAIDGPA
jgi:hypothetical protein